MTSEADNVATLEVGAPLATPAPDFVASAEVLFPDAQPLRDSDATIRAAVALSNSAEEMFILRM